MEKCELGPLGFNRPGCTGEALYALTGKGGTYRCCEPCAFAALRGARHAVARGLPSDPVTVTALLPSPPHIRLVGGEHG